MGLYAEQRRALRADAADSAGGKNAPCACLGVFPVQNGTQGIEIITVREAPGFAFLPGKHSAGGGPAPGSPAGTRVRVLCREYFFRYKFFYLFRGKGLAVPFFCGLRQMCPKLLGDFQHAVQALKFWISPCAEEKIRSQAGSGLRHFQAQEKMALVGAFQ